MKSRSSETEATPAAQPRSSAGNARIDVFGRRFYDRPGNKGASFRDLQARPVAWATPDDYAGPINMYKRARSDTLQNVNAPLHTIGARAPKSRRRRPHYECIDDWEVNNIGSRRYASRRRRTAPDYPARGWCPSLIFSRSHREYRRARDTRRWKRVRNRERFSSPTCRPCWESFFSRQVR